MIGALDNNTMMAGPVDPVDSSSLSSRVTSQERKDADPSKDSKRSAVSKWLSIITVDKKRWEEDFKRMERDDEFAFGLQRDEQLSLHNSEYQCNLVGRNINQKVASLYAKNPTAEFQRRKRRDFQVWDEKLETLEPIVQKVALGGLPSYNEMVLMLDYTHGMEMRHLIDNVGDTLQKAYQYQMDEHDPDFKTQMKNLVRRVCTCGVGYVYLSLARDVESVISSDGMDNSIIDRARRLKEMLTRMEEDGTSGDTTNPNLEAIKSLMQSMMLAVSGQEAVFTVNERLVFDFLPATSVIPDSNCRSLKGFIGARHITVERVLPLDEVNAFFETDVKVTGEVKIKPEQFLSNKGNNNTIRDTEDRPLVTLYEVIDKTTKTHFFLVDGYQDYVCEPEPITPSVKGFWPVYSLTFNDSEHIPGTKSSIFPPSDVTLMRHPQKEWNRTREALRKQRNANAAKYVTQKGWLTEADKDKLEFAEDNAVIELEGLPDKTDPSKALTPMEHDKIEVGDQRYDTSPLMMDVLMSVGAQEANIGPPNPKGTATGQSIAEQSRNVGITSNIDDLDDFLSLLAAGGGELMIQGMSVETVKKIVGLGAVWPQTAREDFLNEIYLRVVAASSGRPNKVLEMNNWNLLAPILMQLGANPNFMVRETIKRLDDSLDPNDAFPLTPQQVQSPQEQAQAQVQNGSGQPPKNKQGMEEPPQQQRPGPGKIGPNDPSQVGQVQQPRGFVPQRVGPQNQGQATM